MENEEIKETNSTEVATELLEQLRTFYGIRAACSVLFLSIKELRDDFSDADRAAIFRVARGEDVETGENLSLDTERSAFLENVQNRVEILLKFFRDGVRPPLVITALRRGLEEDYKKSFTLNFHMIKEHIGSKKMN